MRPCDERKKCPYEYYDSIDNNYACAIDYEGNECPYTKPWGKRKYARDMKEVEKDG